MNSLITLMYIIWFFLFFSFSCVHHRNRLIVKTDQTVSINRSPSKQTKKRLFVFETIPAPWLEKYLIIKKEVDRIIKKKKDEIIQDAKSLFQDFPTTALLPL